LSLTDVVRVRRVNCVYCYKISLVNSTSVTGAIEDFHCNVLQVNKVYDSVVSKVHCVIRFIVHRYYIRTKGSSGEVATISLNLVLLLKLAKSNFLALSATHVGHVRTTEEVHLVLCS
jgi:hypothetical protein